MNFDYAIRQRNRNWEHRLSISHLYPVKYTIIVDSSCIGRAMGLDRDDIIVHGRMRQMLELQSDDLAAFAKPTEEWNL